MLNMHKINPMVRAIATMGVVAGVVAGISFAQIPSNTVTLNNNTLTSATASLGIGLTSNCSDQSTAAVQGMNFTNLLPTVASSPFTFCIDNTGNTPLALSVNTTTSFTGSAINPNDVTLNIQCGVGGATTGAVNFTSTVGGLTTSQAFDTSLNNSTNNVLSCTATATLDSSVTTSNASLTPFNINFTGSTIDS